MAQFIVVVRVGVIIEAANLDEALKAGELLVLPKQPAPIVDAAVVSTMEDRERLPGEDLDRIYFRLEGE